MPVDRRVLPNRRGCESHEVEWLGKKHVVSLGRYNDGMPSEVFIGLNKAGSELDGVARDGAVLISLALQYGVPFSTIASAITRNGDGSPSTIIGKVIDIILKEQSE